MKIFMLIFLFRQPVLPQLPPPPELEPPQNRPLVIPLENDTLGVEVVVGSPFGFGFLFRQDGSVFSTRGWGSAHERVDHFRGLEGRGLLDAVFVFQPFQVHTRFEGVYFQDSSSVSGYIDPLYANSSLDLLWHLEEFLAAMQTSGYYSTMTQNRRRGGKITLRFFSDRPWGNLLSRTQIMMSPEGQVLISDGFFQSQLGIVLLTPRLQGSIDFGTDTPLGGGAGLNVLGVLGNLTLEIDGIYHCFSLIDLDTFLIDPVYASILPGFKGYEISDRGFINAGYQGVELGVFFERGEWFSWQFAQTDGIAEISRYQDTRFGLQTNMRLERKNVSNTGRLRVLASTPSNFWIPPWEFVDSLAVSIEPWGGFIVLNAEGERHCTGLEEPAYVLLGCGLWFEREPFRLLLRVDDLLDFRPQRWPGLRDPGRRFSLTVSLFSTEW